MEKTEVFKRLLQEGGQQRPALLSCASTKSSLPRGSVEKYGILEERYAISVPGRSYICKYSGSRYVIGAEVEIKYDRSEWVAHGLDRCLSQPLSLFDPLSFFEFEIGGQRHDRTYMFAMDIMQKLFYGTKLSLLKKTDTHVIIVLPLMFEHMQVGNVLPCVVHSSFKINCQFLYNPEFPCIASDANIMLKTLNCKEYSLLEGYRGEGSAGEKVIIQQQFTGTEHLFRGAHHKIRLNFNHLCHNLFIGFRYPDSTSLVQSPYLLKRLKLQMNGFDAICVDNPSQIYGKCSQFICPKFSPNQLNNSGERPVFPAEVWVNIISFLNFPDARKLSLTCKYLWNFSKHNLVWDHMTKEYTNEIPGWFCLPFFDHAITNYQRAITDSLNFSRIDNVTLVLEFNEHEMLNDLECLIFTTNFNLLRSLFGMMGLVFSM